MPGQEQVLTYPHPAIKLTNGVPSYLHRDHLGSIRAITDATGTRVESAVYKPFGEQTEWRSPTQPASEDKGWIGERYDTDTGLQYLNARYYDPVLGMFLQPDWFEVLKPGVGTNRFSYSFNDPVNKLDPMGNATFGKSFDSNPEKKKVASDAAERDRSALLDLANTAERAEVRLSSGKRLGFFSGLSDFRQRYERSFGPVTIEGLRQLQSDAKRVADFIGVDGEGVLIEHMGLAEQQIRSANPSITDRQFEREMRRMFGFTSFSNPDAPGTSTGYADRTKRALAWAQVWGNRILLDNAFAGQYGTIAHEGAHGELQRIDHHSLANQGYGGLGIADALANGVAWQNADSFACMVKRC